MGLLKQILTVCVFLALIGSDITIAQAPQMDSNSCMFFSPDPDDRSGPPVIFAANLSADEESAPTESPGIGRVDFSLDRATLRLDWTLTYKDLTSTPTGVHIHGPQTPGGEAGIVLDLAPEGMTSLLQGSAIFNDGDVLYMIQDRLYVNLHTEKYPAGELRGEIEKQRPTC